MEQNNMRQNNEKIRGLPLDFPIPDLLEHDIQALVDAVERGQELLDCEESEILGSVNMSLMAGAINQDQARWIRDYYAYGGYLRDV
jgi:hypothetical protein